MRLLSLMNSTDVAGERPVDAGVEQRRKQTIFCRGP